MSDTIRLEVGGMTCDGCSSRVRDALQAVSGVSSAEVSHEQGSAIISHSGASRENLSSAVRAIGYTVDGLGEEFHWRDGSVWRQSAHNTKWCLIGCSIGDFGTILFFQLTKIPFPVLGIMILAIINGLITSITLETIILMKQDLDFSKAFKTAMGMSFISMISMEVAMNLTDYFLTGGAILTWWVIPIMLIVGFLTPWPYNYWRLKKFGIACH